MKFLIWFAVLLVPSLIATVLRKCGIFLGGIPTFLLYAVCFFVAKFLCSRWDIHSFNKEARKQGKSPWEYAQAKFSRGILMMCEANKHDKMELKRVLKQSAKEGIITKSELNILLDMFCDESWF